MSSIYRVRESLSLLGIIRPHLEVSVRWRDLGELAARGDKRDEEESSEGGEIERKASGGGGNG